VTLRNCVDCDLIAKPLQRGQVAGVLDGEEPPDPCAGVLGEAEGACGAEAADRAAVDGAVDRVAGTLDQGQAMVTAAFLAGEQAFRGFPRVERPRVLDRRSRP